MTKKITLMCNGKKLEIQRVNNDNNEGSQNSSEVRAPGAGIFEISDLSLSAREVKVGASVSCRAVIKGKNISQITQEVMIQAGDLFVGPIQRGFLTAPKNKENKGVVHPHWEAENEIEFEFKPSGRLLFCGEGFTLACMTPERYGVSPELQTWSLEGVYQRGGGEPFRVKLEFDNQGSLVRKTGFSPASVSGVVFPFELLIEDGDTFEPYVTLINENGELSMGTVNAIMLGGGNQLRWEQIDACSGVYHLGIVIDDFDGQKTRAYTPFTVNKEK